MNLYVTFKSSLLRYGNVYNKVAKQIHYPGRHDMRKSIPLLLVVVLFVFLAHSLVCAAEVIKLKAANYLPVTHSIDQDREIQAMKRSVDRIAANITMQVLNINKVQNLF
jgi:hypothetical protein